MEKPDASVELERLLKARRREHSRESRTAIAYCILMMTVALLANWPMLRVVTAMLACVRGFAVYFIIRHQRILDAAASTQQSARTRLEAVFKLESAFVKSSVYWYALPLSLGLVGIAFAIWHHARSIPMVVLCVILAIGTTVGARRLNAQKLAEMETIRGAVVGSSSAEYIDEIR